VINTSTTIITFLMVFLIHCELASLAREKLRTGKLDTDSPELKSLS
jgi:low affinity Fe/Cu permease